MPIKLELKKKRIRDGSGLESNSTLSQQKHLITNFNVPDDNLNILFNIADSVRFTVSDYAVDKLLGIELSRGVKNRTFVKNLRKPFHFLHSYSA